MTQTPPPPSGEPEGGGTPPPGSPNPYGSEPAPASPPPPQNPYSSAPPPPSDPYSSAPPPPSDPYAGNPPAAGQTPYGSAPPPPTGQNPYGASPYPVSSGPAPVAGAQPAGLGSRFLARLIDGLLFLVVNLIIAAASERWLAQVIGGVLYLGYYVYMESNQGHTLGKQWLHMRVYGAAGGNPTMEEAFRRNAWYLLSIISSIPVLIISGLFGLASLVAVIAIAVTISQDPLKRGWHDKFANTSVVKEA